MAEEPELQELLRIVTASVTAIFRDQTIAQCLSSVLEEEGYDTKARIIDDLEDEEDCLIITNLTAQIREHDEISYLWSSPKDEHTLYVLLCQIFKQPASSRSCSWFWLDIAQQPACWVPLTKEASICIQTLYGDGPEPRSLLPFHLPQPPQGGQSRRIHLVPHTHIPMAIECHHQYALLCLPSNARHTVFGFEVHSTEEHGSAPDRD